jgi:hypothetical protein
MTAVQMGQAAAKFLEAVWRDWWPRQASQRPAEEEADRPRARLHRARAADENEVVGFRYQKCGGGRRVIKRRKGGD